MQHSAYTLKHMMHIVLTSTW